MPFSWNPISRQHISLIINILASLFFITVLMFKKGYNYVPMILGGISVIYLSLYLVKFKQKWTLDKEDKGIIYAFLLYFATFVMSAVVHGDGFREIDNPSRILLFIPLILLFTQFPLKPQFIFHAIPIGATVTGLLAIYQKFILGIKAFANVTHHIQSGNISVTLSMLSVVVGIYWFVKKDYKFVALCLIGALFGLLSSAISGARGGWVGLPFVVLAILFFYRQHLNKKLLMISLVAFIVFVTVIASIPKFGVMTRYQEAERDIIQYTQKNNKSTSLGARFDMWENAIAGIKQNPILGWGSKGYIELKKQQVTQKTVAKSTLKFNDAHNQYIDAWVKRGLVGLIGLLLVIFVPLRAFLRQINALTLETKCIAILGATHILSTIFYFLSQTFLAHNSGSLFYFFLIVLFYAMLKTNAKTK
ncbi:MAG: O-antigen ligase family protein [[Pasteurella] mairii]|uniref:RfaL protein n=1 Tax=[Pasteurella] mairii TaxID=757 RepID=A0A379B2F1_9PAST|nr:O-antigen ligase family protein [[Pasteurella] mairii]SUB32767.1 RfaL protein [[Pasteurella] mairii]